MYMKWNNNAYKVAILFAALVLYLSRNVHNGWRLMPLTWVLVFSIGNFQCHPDGLLPYVRTRVVSRLERYQNPWAALGFAFDLE